MCNLYIIGGNKLNQDIKQNIKNKIILFDDFEQNIESDYSLIYQYKKKQSLLQKKWLSLQTEVFKKLLSHIQDDEDFKYLLSNIFFEASPLKTNTVYKFFKVY